MTLSIFVTRYINLIRYFGIKKGRILRQKVASDYHGSRSVSCLRTPHVCDFKWHRESILRLDLFSKGGEKRELHCRVDW